MKKLVFLVVFLLVVVMGCYTFPTIDKSIFYVSKMAFVTDVTGYNNYTEKENNEYYSSEIIFVYTELTNLTDNDRGEVWVKVYAVVMDNNDNIVIEDVVMDYRGPLPPSMGLEEVFILYFLDPSRLNIPFGTYKIVLTFTDGLTEETATRIMEFKWCGVPV